MKLFLSPLKFDPDNGIGQVIKAQHTYLPDYGIEFVDTPDEADIIACHIQGWGLPRIDVHHVHGLLWNGDEPGYKPWEGEANQVILETAKKAWAITVPSEWVRMPFKRDLRLLPEVIPHGLNLEEWEPLPLDKRQSFVLWNKNRQDVACNPEAANELARRGIWTVSTFGDVRISDMEVIGPLPHDRMKEVIRQAGVYLSTAKETFGIGILEALACGVPVLGYAHGGILDLVQHKVNGYLVEPGDVDGLESGYHWLMENLEALQPAIAKSVEGRDWKTIMGRYAELYQDVLKRKERQRQQKVSVSVSVVVTCFNYGQYVGQAIESVRNQTMPCELIVVDDASGPDTHAVLEGYRTGNEGVTCLYNSANLGVSESRNRGVGAASGRYVVCLDADDYLEPAYVETLYKALEADRGLGIAYTGLRVFRDNGDSSISAWPPEFDFELMAKPGVPPPNCIPCAAMFRKDMWERAGGYKQEYAPGEDVEFWLRGLSVGFNARRVTDEPLFNYRVHGGSASKTKQYVDITGDKPWTRDRNLMPIAAPTKKPNLVRSYSEPLVSVIIPVGPGHAKYVSKALDSLLAQTFKNWEVIAISDMDDLNEIVNFIEVINDIYPFVTKTATIGRQGAGVARNLGIRAAKAPLLFFLDADDWLMPTALEKLVKGYIKNKHATYVFSDWIKYEQHGEYKQDEADQHLKEYRLNETDKLKREKGLLVEPGYYAESQNCQDYDQEAVRKQIRHAVSVLVETEAVRKVGGFDETLASWEDWDFFLRLAASGYCGARVPEPLLVYRTQTGTRRLKLFEPGNTLYQEITGKWKGVEFMACCGQNAKIERRVIDMTAFPAQAPDVEPGKVRLRYVGQATATVTFLGKYRAAADGVNELVDADAHDVNRLLQLGVFAEV